MTIYCDQMNSIITTHYLTEHLLTHTFFLVSAQYACHCSSSRHPDNTVINAKALIHITFLDKQWDNLEYHLDAWCISSGSEVLTNVR